MNRNMYGIQYTNYNDSSCNNTDQNIFFSAEKCKRFMEAVAEEMLRDYDESDFTYAIYSDDTSVSIVNTTIGGVVEEFTLINFVIQDEK